MFSKPPTIPVTLTELLSMMDYSSSSFDFSKYFIPNTEKPYNFLICVNSGYFVKKKNIKKHPKGYAIPLCICDFLLKRAGFIHVNLISDKHWKRVMGFHLAKTEELAKILFLKSDSIIVNDVIGKGDSEFHVPKNILKGILEQKNLKERGPNGNEWNKFRNLFGTKQKAIISNILTTYSLKCCGVCNKINRSLNFSVCCKVSLCGECAAKEFCPNKCRNMRLVVEKAKTLRQIYEFEGDPIEKEILKFKEKLQNFEDIKKNNSSEFMKFLQKISENENFNLKEIEIIGKDSKKEKNEKEKSDNNKLPPQNFPAQQQQLIIPVQENQAQKPNENLPPQPEQVPIQKNNQHE